MRKTQLIYASIIALGITISGCKKDDPIATATTTPASGYTNGVFITNEGPYGSGTGTVSFYSRSTGSVSADIFNSKNGFPLGNVVQSMEIFNNKGYIIVNNGSKAEVVDATSFATAGTISNLINPRYFIGIDNTKGYLSQWGAGATGEVKIINLATNTVTGTINTGNGAEQMVKIGNYVYVACSGGYVNDSVVTVIDATTNAVVTNINVGANPASLKTDATGQLWVLCGGQWNSGYTALVKTGSLVRINPSNNTITLSLPFASTTAAPSHLIIDQNLTTLYYIYNGGVYAHAITSSVLSASAVINRGFYSLGFDPVSHSIFASDPVDYMSNGKVLRYQTSGTVVDSFAGGIIPGNFCFH